MVKRQDGGRAMSLHDRLNAVTKTKEEVRDAEYKKGYEESYKWVGYFIKEIQDQLMDKAKHGEYTELVNEKKYIELNYFHVSMKYALGVEFEKFRVISEDGRSEKIFAKYYVKDQGNYDGFMKRIFEFSQEEDVSCKIVCQYCTDKEMYDFNPVTGFEIPCSNNDEGSIITFYIQCRVTY